jgi:hypothetical protein
VIGYCIGPLIVSTLFNYIPLMPNILKFAVNIGCVYWAVKCGIRPIKSIISEERRWLVTFPVILYFFFLDWIILMIGGSGKAVVITTST